MKAGLTSISFRNLNVDEIINNTVKAGLDAIEWGGDIHVPHGNVELAEKIRKKTEEKGIVVSSYGSYYRVGVSEKKSDAFKSVLLSAKALNAPCIRVWAGSKELDGCELSDLDDIIKDTYRIAEMAEAEGIFIAFEYHGGTLTATNKSTYLFSKCIPIKNAGFYWQPPVGKDFNYCKEGINFLLKNDILCNVHVFQWSLSEKNTVIRNTLDEGRTVWQDYLNLINKIDIEKDNKKERFALL
ncbi:MAG: hypothetical protein K0S55_2179 [Clostridia bacterium]|nr:hypothetical protein [Clostridia bacterium]